MNPSYRRMPMRRTGWLLLAAVAVAALSGLCASAEEDAAAARARGEALLAKNCSRCHAIGRTGVSPHPDAPLFRALSRRYPIEGLAEALAEGLSVGHPDMPEFVFDPDEIGAILAYLASIQEPR
jgi:mono/diheme cytochrome c family protein